MCTNIVSCPTLREPGGLAVNRRNRRLRKDEKEKAAGIFEALSYIAQNIQPGTLEDMLAAAGNILSRHELRADYVEIATTEDLRLINNWNGHTEIVALIAAYVGNVRLIDNIILPLNFAGYGN